MFHRVTGALVCQPLAICLQQQHCQGLILIYISSKEGQFEFSVRNTFPPPDRYPLPSSKCQQTGHHQSLVGEGWMGTQGRHLAVAVLLVPQKGAPQGQVSGNMLTKQQRGSHAGLINLKPCLLCRPPASQQSGGGAFICAALPQGHLG